MSVEDVVSILLGWTVGSALLVVAWCIDIEWRRRQARRARR